MGFKKAIVKTFTFLASFCLLVLVLIVFNYSTEIDLSERELIVPYSVSSVKLPESVSFAGEEMPLNYSDVFESFDRELHVNTYWHSQTILLIKRANKYFPVIEPILEKNGIPDDFKYLAVAESGLQNTVSPAGAKGFWQFLKNTGIEYGLEINDEVDERYSLEKSTLAACKYLNEAFKKYKSWTLVAASYNMGMGGLDKQIDRQKAANYYDLVLNDETARYVFRIASIKTILENPEDYGFRIRKKDLYFSIPTYKAEIDSAVSNFADFALVQGTNYKMLKVLNPWLRDITLTNAKKKKYIIELPLENARESTFFEKEAGENNVNDSVSME